MLSPLRPLSVSKTARAEGYRVGRCRDRQHKAKEALIAAGIINNIGSTAAPIAAAPSIGISRVVVADYLSLR